MLRSSQKYIRYITGIPKKAFSYIIYFNEIIGESKIYSRYFLALIDSNIIPFNNSIRKNNISKVKRIGFLFTLLYYPGYLNTFFYLIFGYIENCLLREYNKERREIA